MKHRVVVHKANENRPKSIEAYISSFNLFNSLDNHSIDFY